MSSAGAQRWAVRTAVVIVLALASGCGDDDDFANNPRPQPALTISAAITPKRVTVSPARLSAGTVQLLASNQTSTSQRLQLRSARLAPGGQALAQSTGPINPGGTAPLTADLDAGTYVLSARSPAIEPQTIVVEAARDGERDQLLQP